MKLIISQPRYLPALAYLNRLANADIFVLLDTVQRQPRGWENRNKLLTPNGTPKWLTIPISSSKRSLIVDTRVSDMDWVEVHRRKVIDYYKGHPNFNREILDDYYNSMLENDTGEDLNFTRLVSLSLFNISKQLKFHPRILKASSLDENRNNWLTGPEELLRIAEITECDTYVSGPNGRDYGIEKVFSKSNIKTMYHDFDEPNYTQVGSDEHFSYLGFFDYMFNKGAECLSELVREKWILLNN